MKRGTPGHPKTLALVEALQVDLAKACGTLELLWHFTGRYAPRGDVGRWSDEKIAEAVRWSGDPQKLISALVETGWIDSDKTYRLLIHDWSDHCEQTVKKFLARNNLRFATKSGRRPSRVQPPSITPLPLPVPEPVPMPEPDPPPQSAREMAGRNGSGTRPEEEDPAPSSAPSCPRCGVVGSLIREPRTRTDPGWFCAPRRKGCGASLPLGDPRVLDQLPDNVRRSVTAELKERYGTDPVTAEQASQTTDEWKTFFEYDGRTTTQLAEAFLDFLDANPDLDREQAREAWRADVGAPRGIHAVLSAAVFYASRKREHPPP